MEAFNKYRACHQAAELKNKVVPSLKGLFGRKAASSEGYASSDAMKKSGITWAEDTLKTCLADLKAIVPGTRMPFAGLKKEGPNGSKSVHNPGYAQSNRCRPEAIAGGIAPDEIPG